jgi:hypothetical protein
MAQWHRANAPWRQGHLLTAESVRAFALAAPHIADQSAVVVISHDCDLAQDISIEPNAEIVVGQFIERPNGSLTHAKNPRRLHIQCEGEDRRWIELRATERRLIPKESSATGLVDHAPAERFRIEGDALKILQHWLAARYRRSAFPDEFERRIKDETGVAERLARLFGEHGPHVRAVFFEIDKGQEVEHVDGDDPYELFILLLYDTASDPQRAEDQAALIAKGIQSIFEARCYVESGATRVWRWIELTGIEVVADTVLTYAQSQALTKWNVDHVSLKGNPIQPTL